MKTLLVTPPFSQLNTPYPATTYLTSYLRSKQWDVDQVDLGIFVINRLFSKKGLERVFKHSTTGRIGALKQDYLNTIGPVMKFLQGSDPTLAHRIVSGDYLPQGDRFDSSEESTQSSAFDITDRARYLSTLYLNDISDYIQQNIDENFGFSRYSERLALSPSDFSTVEAELKGPKTLIMDMILELWEELLEGESYDLIGFTIPFPGNLISTLTLSAYIKERRPETRIVIGGGWVNTELRSLTEVKLFNYVDYVVLDDGEVALNHLLHHIKDSSRELLRTYTLTNGKVVFNTSNSQDEVLDSLPAPTYDGLDLNLYISLLDTLNPMHSLWNRGRWNKLTLAHGCYWKRCAFCDTNLPYIRDYRTSNASIIVDKIEKMIEETGESGFHFVDEAAPPALLKEVSLELLRRGLSITWWTNIRFEKRFTPGLARLMAKSGCIAVSGGVEVASDRLLKVMDKGVTVDQVVSVTSALGSAGIMVHAYLMYGFPTQTDQEVIDALEVVRQLFKMELIDSAYWHQFALTAHSPVGHNPQDFEIEISGPEFRGFAQNDLEFNSSQKDPSRFSQGLKTSLYNYMRGNGLDMPLGRWFNFPTPKTQIKKNYLQRLGQHELELKNSTLIIWLGNVHTSVYASEEDNYIYLYDNKNQERILLDENERGFVLELTKSASYRRYMQINLEDVDRIAEKWNIDPDLWLSQDTAMLLYSYGLILH